jgi:hypothetical protein
LRISWFMPGNVQSADRFLSAPAFRPCQSKVTIPGIQNFARTNDVAIASPWPQCANSCSAQSASLIAGLAGSPAGRYQYRHER